MTLVDRSMNSRKSADEVTAASSSSVRARAGKFDRPRSAEAGSRSALSSSSISLLVFPRRTFSFSRSLRLHRLLFLVVTRVGDCSPSDANVAVSDARRWDADHPSEVCTALLYVTISFTGGAGTDSNTVRGCTVEKDKAVVGGCDDDSWTGSLDGVEVLARSGRSPPKAELRLLSRPDLGPVLASRGPAELGRPGSTKLEIRLSSSLR